MSINNPFDLILSELAEVKSEIRKIRFPEPPAPYPENLTVNQAINFLSEIGYPTTLAQVYKLSSLGEIPASRIGKRLVFSRKALQNWIESRKVMKVSPQRIATDKLAQSARKRKRERVTA